jgi:DNA gyrase/topoisomerase IV subunit A
MPACAAAKPRHRHRADRDRQGAGLSDRRADLWPVGRARRLSHRPWPRGDARAYPLRGSGAGNRQAIIVDELPYQVNKRTLLERMAELVNEKKIEGISEIRDESDKSGMRVVIELKRNEVPEVVLNNLFKQTQLQDTFGMNMVALVDGRPRTLNLKQMLDCFLSHRREVITRRTIFELRKARERGHILEGLAVALSNVDEIIALIKAAPGTGRDAKRELLARTWRSALVEEMLARAESTSYRPRGWRPNSVCRSRATDCPTCRLRRFSNCACSA